MASYVFGLEKCDDLGYRRGRRGYMAVRKLYATDRETLEEETDITFYRGSGPGGQNRNKVETGVRLFHRPSNITLQADEKRSQARNRDIVFERLSDILKELNSPSRPRLPTKVPRSQKKKRLTNKRIQGAKKQQRQPPPDQ